MSEESQKGFNNFLVKYLAFVCSSSASNWIAYSLVFHFSFYIFSFSLLLFALLLFPLFPYPLSHR